VRSRSSAFIRSKHAEAIERASGYREAEVVVHGTEHVQGIQPSIGESRLVAVLLEPPGQNVESDLA